MATVSITKSLAACLALTLLTLCCYNPTAAASTCKTCLRGLLVLGDSISDGGLPYGLWSVNNATVPLNRLGYDNGRFSNGPIWPEYLAYSKKVSVLNLAIAGATVNHLSNLTLSSLTSTLDQLVAKAATLLSKAPLPQPAAAVIFVGSNDFVYVPQSVLGNSTALAAYLANIPAGIATASRALMQMGFTNIVIANTPAVNLCPTVRVQGPLVQAVTLTLVKQVNDGIAKVVQALGAASPKGTKVMLWDTFAYVTHAVAHPSRGMDVMHNCLVTDPQSTTNPLSKLVSTCKDPSKYYFWDALHPTTTFHQKISDDLVRVGKRYRLFR